MLLHPGLCAAQDNRGWFKDMQTSRSTLSPQTRMIICAATTLLRLWSQKLDWTWLRYLGTRLVNQKGATASSIPCFIVYLPLNGTINYKMNTMLYWRRLETCNSDGKLIQKLFNQVINQVRGRVIFSWVYIRIFESSRVALMAIRKNAGLRHIHIGLTF